MFSSLNLPISVFYMYIFNCHFRLSGPNPNGSNSSNFMVFTFAPSDITISNSLGLQNSCMTCLQTPHGVHKASASESSKPPTTGYLTKIIYSFRYRFKKSCSLRTITRSICRILYVTTMYNLS